MKPPNKKRKCETLQVPCEWNGCKCECSGDWELNTHIATHLSEYLALDETQTECICTWTECEFKTSCREEFQRHVYYHGYYASLLVQGRQECAKHSDIPQCNAPARKGHIMPDLKLDFQCRWADCERSFFSIVEFQDHIVQHASFEYEIQKSPEDERPKTQCNWDFCHKPLENKYRLIEHIRTHSNKKYVACDRCGELFRTKTTLFDHLRRQPDNNTHQYQCAQCLKYFATEKLLRVHVIKHVNCFKCTMCDMTCSSSSALATHIRYRHLKDKPFKCEQCETRCVRQSDLTKHVQMVHSKEGHRCEEPGCQYMVRTYTQMRRHVLEVHHNSPIIYVCHCCDKFLKSGKSLSTHLIKKHDFQLPSGHKRFTYRQDENGFYRLETMRIESLEVTQQILSPNPSATSTETTNASESNSNSYEIVTTTTTSAVGERVVVSQDPNNKASQLVGEVIISLPDLVEL